MNRVNQQRLQCAVLRVVVDIGHIRRGQMLLQKSCCPWHQVSGIWVPSPRTSELWPWHWPLKNPSLRCGLWCDLTIDAFSQFFLKQLIYDIYVTSSHVIDITKHKSLSPRDCRVGAYPKHPRSPPDSCDAQSMDSLRTIGFAKKTPGNKIPKWRFIWWDNKNNYLKQNEVSDRQGLAIPSCVASPKGRSYQLVLLGNDAKTTHICR